MQTVAGVEAIGRVLKSMFFNTHFAALFQHPAQSWFLALIFSPAFLPGRKERGAGGDLATAC